MKILMIGWVDFRVSDAASIHFSEVANAFYTLGNNVQVFVPKENTDKFFSEGIMIHKMCENYKECLSDAILYNSLTFLRVSKFLKNGNYDLIYIRWRMFPNGILKKLLPKNSKCKIVSEHNGWIPFEAKLQHNNFLISLIGKFLQVLDAKTVDKVIAVTDGIKTKFLDEGIPKERVKVVGNGTNTTHFFPILDRIEQKESLIKTKEVVLGFIGNISKWQGIDDLIDVYLLIKNKVNAKVLIIGSGLYKDELVKRIKKYNLHNDVIVKDNVAYDEVNKYMNIIDIAFAPKSFKLNEIGYSPLKIRDYAAAGKVVISTAVNGIKELEAFGWLKTYDPQNIKSLEDILIDLISDHDKRREMEINARNYAEEHFSWKKIAEKILKNIE